MTWRRTRTVPGWNNDLRVKMRKPKDKEVDIGTDSTENDQHSPGKSYLFQFFTLNNNITHWKSRRHCRLDGIRLKANYTWETPANLGNIKQKYSFSFSVFDFEVTFSQND